MENIIQRIDLLEDKVNKLLRKFKAIKSENASLEEKGRETDALKQENEALKKLIEKTKELETEIHRLKEQNKEVTMLKGEIESLKRKEKIARTQAEKMLEQLEILTAQ